MASPVETKVIAILAMLKKVPAEKIQPESTLEGLGVDSLDKINLLFEMESAFDIDIPDDSVTSIKTVGDIVQKLEAMGVTYDPNAPKRAAQPRPSEA